MASPAATTKEFLSTLWGDSKGFAELTAINKAGIKAFPFSYPDSLDSLVSSAMRHNRDANVYMGVCLRRDKWPRQSGRTGPDGRPEIEKRGTELNTLCSMAVWCEFDFAEQGHKGKTIPEADARKALKEFPLKPSIVIRSGGGIQVYWLQKEPITGDDLWKMKAVNKALVKALGGDPQSVDLARILRIPGTQNIKYTPHRPCEISWWHPEWRYTLHDFEFLPTEDIQKPVDPAVAAAAGGPQSAQARQVPAIHLDENKISEMAKLFGQFWFEGHRHAMALRVAGMLAFAGVSLESAQAIVAGASNAAGGDTTKRLKDVEDTYRTFIQGGETTGGPALDKMIDEEFPLNAKEKSKKAMASIRRLLPKPPRPRDVDGAGNSSADFEIMRVIKFDSRPARFTVVIRKTGEETEYHVPCETVVMTDIKAFRKAFFETTENKFIAMIKQWRWEAMVADAPLEIRPAPKEATLPGAIMSTLEDFLEQKKENPELGQLKTFPGYNENEIYFQLRAFRGRLKDNGLKASDHVITDVLKQDGWKDDRRWISDKNPRLWVKLLSLNGPSHPPENGKASPEPPPVKADLFGTLPEDPPSEGVEEGSGDWGTRV